MRLVSANRDRLGEFFPWAQTHSRVLESGWLRALPHERRKGIFHFAVVKKNRPVGSFSVYLDSPETLGVWGSFGSVFAEVTYWLAETAEGQGLMGESLNAMVVALFGLGVGEVYAEVNETNMQSIALLKRSGFVEYEDEYEGENSLYLHETIDGEGNFIPPTITLFKESPFKTLVTPHPMDFWYS
jgi:RimJ/RimL family protein N-acetyltransferase